MAATQPHNPLEGDRPELSINLHDGSEEQVSIVVVHKDRPEYLNICLQSIAVTSFNNNYEIIVVDNASTDGTWEYLKDLGGKIIAIHNEKNLGFAKACNKGARIARGEYLLFLNKSISSIS